MKTTGWNRLALAGLGVMMAQAAFANAADIAYIRSKLVFHYIPNPNDTTGAFQIINVDDVINNRGSGEFYTQPRLEIFRNMMKALLTAGPVAGKDTAELDRYQAVVAEILRITNGVIQVRYVKDTELGMGNAIPITGTWQQVFTRYGVLITDQTVQGSATQKQVWPAAYYFTDGSPERTQFPGHGGRIGFGSWVVTRGDCQNFTRALGVMCHELMHTQDLSDGRAHLHLGYRYGADGTHFLIEVLPELAGAYKEGIANFGQYGYDNSELNRITTAFTNDDMYVVETTAPTAAAAPMNLYNILRNAPYNLPGVALAGTTWTNYRGYRPRELPPHILMQNEQIIGMIVAHTGKINGFRSTMRNFRLVNRVADRTCIPIWAELITTMSQSALPAGRTVAQLQSANFNEPRRYFVPLALCDFFTHYRANTREEFRRLFEGSWTGRDVIDRWIDAYFGSGARDLVKNGTIAEIKTRLQIP